ncbi:hypothetical protein EP7_000098 [Isosphaeraceae bacterium EP7]
MLNSELETIEPNEQAMIAELVETQRRLHAIEGTPGRRPQHPKQHGLVKADLVVGGGLADELRHGLFREPRTFEAWVRYSNGKGEDDRKKGLRGMAVKVLGTDDLGASEQDFIAIDMPTFFIRNNVEYLDLTRALLAARGGFPRSYLLPGLNPLGWHPGRLLRLSKVFRKCGDLLAARFYSTTPYRLGPRAIKFSFRPIQANGPPLPMGTTPDFLRDRLVATLNDRPAEFDLLVQIQGDPTSMPVEDPTVDWDDARPTAPWHKVATLRMPIQNPATPERLALAEAMAFTPWHTLPDHQPLGGINRARKAIYEATQADRLAVLGRSEPARPREGD